MYGGGFDKPFVASVARITEGLEDEGFRVLQMWECGELYPPSTGCGDSWDWVGIVQRVGPTTDLEVPSRVKWVREVAPAPLPIEVTNTMPYGPFPLSPHEDCQAAAAHCAAVGWKLGGCSPNPAGGGMFSCEGPAPQLPEPRTTEPKKPPFPWGIAAVGALLAGVAVYAVYTDPSR